jgi:hypothetical protein
MASKKLVLAELGNVVMEASKKCKDPMTPKIARKEWLIVLEKSAKAYADISSIPAPKSTK